MAVLESRFAFACAAHAVSRHPAGPVAQLAEQQTLNLRVVGSIPTRLTTLRKALSAFFHPPDRTVGCVWVADGCVSSSRSTAFVAETSGIQCAYTRSVIEASRWPSCLLT
jgi:hypothetical protein